MTEALSTEETELIQRAAAGDSAAFGALVQPHLALFHNGIHRILGNAADTQDALQDALLSIHRDLPRAAPLQQLGLQNLSQCRADGAKEPPADPGDGTL